MMTKYTTKVTWLGNKYGCRVYHSNTLIVEGRCNSKIEIGATFRDLLRTLDKLGGDSFTSASRKRKYKEGNPMANVKHLWNETRN